MCGKDAEGLPDTREEGGNGGAGDAEVGLVVRGRRIRRVVVIREWGEVTVNIPDWVSDDGAMVYAAGYTDGVVPTILSHLKSGFDCAVFGIEEAR